MHTSAAVGVEMGLWGRILHRSCYLLCVDSRLHRPQGAGRHAHYALHVGIVALHVDQEQIEYVRRRQAAVIVLGVGNGVGVVQAVELNELVELLLFPSCRSAAGGYVVVKALVVAEHGGLVVPQLAYFLLKVAHLVGMACVLPFKLAYPLGIFGYQAVALGYGLLGPVYAF